MVQLPLPVYGMPSSSSDEITDGLERRDAVDAFAEVEREVGLRAADALDPATVGIHGNADGSCPSAASTASTASTVSRMARSGDFPSAEMPSKSTTTFM